MRLGWAAGAAALAVLVGTACTPVTAIAACTLYPDAPRVGAMGVRSPICASRGTLGGKPVRVPDRYVKSFVEFWDDDVWSPGFQPGKGAADKPIRSFSVPVSVTSWTPIEREAERKEFEDDSSFGRRGYDSRWVVLSFNDEKGKSEASRIGWLINWNAQRGGKLREVVEKCGLEERIFWDHSENGIRKALNLFTAPDKSVVIECWDITATDGVKLYSCEETFLIDTPGVYVSGFFWGPKAVCEWSKIESAAKSLERGLHEAALRAED